MKKYYCKCGNEIRYQTALYGKKRCIICANSNLKCIFVTKEFLLKEYIKNKKSTEQIAKECKCGRSLIRYRLKKFGIKTYNKSESHLGKKRPLFTKQTRLKMRNKKLGIKLSLKHRKNLIIARRKNKVSNKHNSKYELVKHHIDLNKRHNKNDNILKIIRSVHSYLHNSAYEYLVKKGIIKNYIKWFFKYKMKEKARQLLQEINEKTRV